MAREYLARDNVGLVIGVVFPGGRRVFGYGRRGGEGGDSSPDQDTIFEIGSITKVFTAALLADMARRGEVRLDDPVQRYLPAGVQVPTRGGRAITLLHLATHTSGLPRLPGNLGRTVRDRANPYAHYTVDDLYAFLNGCRLARVPGERYAYSNLGAGLLGHVLALRAGMGYEALVTRRLCGPLGMMDTAVTLSPEQRGRLAQGHAASDEPVPLWDLPMLAGAGALRSTARDMLAFLAANLESAGDEDSGGNARDAVLRTLALTHAVRYRPGPPPPEWPGYAAAVAAPGIAYAALRLLPPRIAARLPFLLLSLAVFGAAHAGGPGPGLLATLLAVAAGIDVWRRPDPVRGALARRRFIARVIGLGVLGGAFSLYGDVRRRLEMADSTMGLGWHVAPLGAGGRQVLWHNGGTGGFSSFAGIVKETRTGVVVLSNTANGVDAVGVRVLRLLDGGEGPTQP